MVKFLNSLTGWDIFTVTIYHNMFFYASITVYIVLSLKSDVQVRTCLEKISIWRQIRIDHMSPTTSVSTSATQTCVLMPRFFLYWQLLLHRHKIDLIENLLRLTQMLMDAMCVCIDVRGVRNCIYIYIYSNKLGASLSEHRYLTSKGG